MTSKSRNVLVLGLLSALCAPMSAGAQENAPRLQITHVQPTLETVWNRFRISYSFTTEQTDLCYIEFLEGSSQFSGHADFWWAAEIIENGETLGPGSTYSEGVQFSIGELQETGPIYSSVLIDDSYFLEGGEFKVRLRFRFFECEYLRERMDVQALQDVVLERNYVNPSAGTIDLGDGLGLGPTLEPFEVTSDWVDVSF